MNDQELDPAVEVIHLRRLLDVQPGCLMRLAADGTVLAANDAALSLLGAGSGADALGRDFTTWLPADQHDRWKAFATGVVDGTPSSIECEVCAAGGDRAATLLHGIPLVGHPDGLTSMAVAARAITAQRQLEAAIGDLGKQVNELKAALDAGNAALAAAEFARAAAESALDVAETRVKAAETARDAAEAQCARALADVRQLELALNEFAARQQQRDQELNAERDRLARALHEQATQLEALAKGMSAGVTEERA